MPEITNFPGATAYDAKGVPTIPATFPVDPAPQFRAAWLHIAKMGNRVVGTTTERSAAAAWAWDGLAFYDTTEKREYIRVAGAWDLPDVSFVANLKLAFRGTATARVVNRQVYLMITAPTGASFPTGLTTITETPIPAELRPRAGDANARGLCYFDFAQTGHVAVTSSGHIDVMQQTGAARTFMSGAVSYTI